MTSFPSARSPCRRRAVRHRGHGVRRGGRRGRRRRRELALAGVHAATGGDGSGTAQTSLVTATKQLADAAGQLADATSSSSDLGKATTGLAGGALDLASGLGDIDSEYLAVAQQALADGDYAKAATYLVRAHHRRPECRGHRHRAGRVRRRRQDGLLGDDGVHTGGDARRRRPAP